jgi:hypothetical protein
VNATQLLPLIRDLYSKRAETRYLMAWELQHVLWSLHYTDTLEDEASIAAAADVARTDYEPDRRTA